MDDITFLIRIEEEANVLCQMLTSATNYPLTRTEDNPKIIWVDGIPILELVVKILFITSIREKDVDELVAILPYVPKWMFINNPYFQYPDENYTSVLKDWEISEYIDNHFDVGSEEFSEYTHLEVDFNDSRKLSKSAEDTKKIDQRFLQRSTNLLFSTMDDDNIIKYIHSSSIFDLEIAGKVSVRFIEIIDDLTPLEDMLVYYTADSYDEWRFIEEAKMKFKVRNALLTLGFYEQLDEMINNREIYEYLGITR